MNEPHQTSSTRRRGGLGAGWLTWARYAFLLLGMGLLLCCVSGLFAPAAADTGRAAAGADGVGPKPAPAVPPPPPAAVGQPRIVLKTKPIEQVRVGDRVPSHHPRDDEQDDSLGRDVDPASWRLLELRAPKQGGGWADIQLLRPASWLEQRNVHAGGKVGLSLPECGIDGDAEVLSVGPCPALQPGSGRVVTGTFRHTGVNVLDVRLEGTPGSIGVTPNHLFWSADREEFVRADALSAGERLSTLGGTVRVLDVTEPNRAAAVYNLEVQVDHVYHVSTEGVLVHNGNEIPLLPDGYGLKYQNKGGGKSIIYEIKAKVGNEWQFYVGKASFRERLRKNHPAHDLLTNGKDVTITIREIDYTGAADIAKAETAAGRPTTENQVMRRITQTAEYNALNNALDRNNVNDIGGTGTKNGETYRNVNDPVNGRIIGTDKDPNKPQDYVDKYSENAKGRNRLSRVKETVKVGGCAK